MEIKFDSQLTKNKASNVKFEALFKKTYYNDYDKPLRFEHWRILDISSLKYLYNEIVDLSFSLLNSEFKNARYKTKQINLDESDGRIYYEYLICIINDIEENGYRTNQLLHELLLKLKKE